MTGISVNQLNDAYSNSIINNKSTVKASIEMSFSATITNVCENKISGKKRIQPEESTVDKYISKHPDRKADVEQMVNAGKNVIKQYLGENYNPDDLSLEEYKELINNVISRIPYDPSQLNDIEYLNITEDGYKQMKSDPKYEAWVLGYFKIDRAVHFPFGAQGNYHAEHFGASIEEHHGESYHMDLDKGKDDDSWWKKRKKRHDMLMEQREKYYEKRRNEREAAMKKNVGKITVTDTSAIFSSVGANNTLDDSSYLGDETSAAAEFFMMIASGSGTAGGGSIV